MKKITLLLIFVLTSATMMMAAPRSTQQMLNEARRALAAASRNRTSAQTPANAGTPEILQQETQLAVIGYRDGGFAVIAVDDRFNAVLGYADDPFVIEKMPPALLWWIETMNASLENLLAAGDVAANELPTDMGLAETVSPLLTTQWNQDTPYNDQCPTYTSGETTKHYVTGCVATAMAQVMYYHRYPTKATEATYTYTFYPNGEENPGQETTAEFGAPYDWDNMIANYEKTTYTTEQAEAVAMLMYHCGVAVDMNYANSGSGSHYLNAAKGFKTYFDYSTKFYNRSYFSTKEWTQLMYSELADEQPVLYSGVSTQGGHAFVFDGYDADGKVHVNWGWGGYADGYFDVATLNGFSGSQTMLFAHSLDDASNEIPYTSMWGYHTNFNVTVSSGTSLSFNAVPFMQIDQDPFTGDIGVVIEATNATFKKTCITIQRTDVPYGRGWTYQFGTPISLSGYADGEYRIYVASKSDKEDTWQPLHGADNVTSCYLVKKEGDVLTLSKESSDWIVTGIEGIEIPLTATGKADDKVRVYNAQGQLVYTSSADNFRIDNIPARGLLIIQQGNQTRKITK
ncbi:MAG: C10 family peptidase [Prevotella sp.]